MIPEGKTIDDIKARETIIRDFYREWKNEKVLYFHIVNKILINSRNNSYF